MLKEYCNSGHGVGIAILMHFLDTGGKGNDSEEWLFLYCLQNIQRIHIDEDIRGVSK